MQPNLRMALQRSGRLAEGSLTLLQKCGIKAQATKNQLLTQDTNFGIDFIFSRDDDIPGLITNGICDIGIIGQNLLAEYKGTAAISAIQTIMPLKFAQCRLSLATPKGQNYQKVQDIAGKTIATSYPNILANFLAQQGIDAQIVTMHGSVELAPQIGISDLICDLVSSGATLHENGLEEFTQVKASEAILIRRTTVLSSEKQQLLDRLILRINGVLNANQKKYIMLHIERSKLPLLSEILPSSESPTILELQGMPEKVAVHVVSAEDIFWETMEKLKAIGASSILVLPIEKMIF